MSFVGGKLKLKGGEAAGVKKKKKRSEKKIDATDAGALVQATSGSLEEEKAAVSEPVATKDGYVLPKRRDDEDKRTEAEKKHDAKVCSPHSWHDTGEVVAIMCLVSDLRECVRHHDGKLCCAALCIEDTLW
jgi:hypothetical protein